MRHTLSQGIRLPSPDFCPPEVAAVIQQCFLPNPNDRPTFQDIKGSILNGYGILIRDIASSHNANQSSTTYTMLMPIDRSVGNQIKERYFQIQQVNENRRQAGTSIANCETIRIEDNTSAFGSLRDQRGRYISLENCFSSDS